MKILVFTLLASLLVVIAKQQENKHSEDSYIAIFYDNVDAAQKADELCKDTLIVKGVTKKFVFQHAINGFSFRASTSPAMKRMQLSRIKLSPFVKDVWPDLPAWFQSSFVPLKPGQYLNPSQKRIGAAKSEKVKESAQVAVAVVDTGIQPDHPDLSNISLGANCIDASQPSVDDNGHGTGVAGIIAASNNENVGTVGTAPGTPLWSVKVLDASGQGSTSTVICGIEWVIANHSNLQGPPIKVINLSLGGPREVDDADSPVPACEEGCACSSPWQEAICRATERGITVVGSAGNAEERIQRSWVASIPEVFAITAMTDTDGRGGRKGPKPCVMGEKDDKVASFSNFALSNNEKVHVLAAPGACITSTYFNSQYALYTGTSEAAPYVSTAVALCHKSGEKEGPCASKTPRQIIQYMRKRARKRRKSKPKTKFIGDPKTPLKGSNKNRYYGYLLYVQ